MIQQKETASLPPTTILHDLNYQCLTTAAIKFSSIGNE